MITTLAQIHAHRPCQSGWNKLLLRLGKTQADDKPLSLETILETNGLDDALWCLRAVEGRNREIRLYAVWCARQVQRLMTDARSIEAPSLAERYARGLSDAEELEASRTNAAEAVRAARAMGADDNPAAAAAWTVTADTWVGRAAWAAAARAIIAEKATAAADAARDAQAAEFRRMLRDGYL